MSKEAILTESSTYQWNAMQWWYIREQLESELDTLKQILEESEVSTAHPYKQASSSTLFESRSKSYFVRIGFRGLNGPNNPNFQSTIISITIHVHTMCLYGDYPAKECHHYYTYAHHLYAKTRLLLHYYFLKFWYFVFLNWVRNPSAIIIVWNVNLKDDLYLICSYI